VDTADVDPDAGTQDLALALPQLQAPCLGSAAPTPALPRLLLVSVGLQVGFLLPKFLPCQQSHSN
ncbi:hypothetical protein P7K49_029846, partial [Saguinus oedipus]